MRYKCKEPFFVSGCSKEGKKLNSDVEIKLNTVWELVENKNVTEFPIRLERPNKKPSWMEISLEALNKHFNPVSG
nr:hypothetical protein [uncultured Cetobacterium sp.]